MELGERYRVRQPEVAYEVVDGEAVILDLNKGFYYSTEAVGTVIWQDAAQGLTQAEIVKHLQAIYTEDQPGQIDGAVARLVDEFLREQLIVPALDVTAPSVESYSYSGGAAPFLEPVLAKHSDLEDLLRLDPIHEVSSEGWPKLPPKE